MPIYPYSFQLPPLNVQDIPNDGAPGEFLGINVGGALDWLPAGGGGTGDLLAANNLSELTNFATARTNIGLGTASTPTFANLTLTSPSLSSSAPVTISQTWGTTGIYTAAKVNVTETATANALSKLLDLQLGTVSKFSVFKDGSVQTTLISTNGVGALNLQYGATGKINCFTDLDVLATNRIAFSDTFLQRDGAANTLALRNGAAAQTFNVYGTYSSITDYKRLSLSCSASTGNATIAAPFNSVLAITGGSSTAGVKATVNFAAQASAFPIGSTVTVTGVTPVGYNGTYTVTESTTTSVSYVNTVNLPWVSGGTATISGSASMTLAAQGNLGIGTATPVANLHVVGVDGDQDTKRVALFQSNDTNIQNNSSVVGITSADVNVNTFLHRLLDLDYTSALGGTVTLGTYMRMLASGVECAGIGLANNEFVITAAAVERLRISAAGNVGIGTTSPTSKLHVAGTIKPEQATMVDIASTTINLEASNAGTIINCTAATAVTVNLPTLDTNAGYNVMIIQSGAGAVTIAANGNTLNSFGSAFTTAGQHAACSIVRTAASTYNLSGNLV